MGRCAFNKEWIDEYSWLQEVKRDKFKGSCKLCKKEFSVSNKGIRDVKQHADGKTHIDNETAAAKTVPIDRAFQSKILDQFLRFCIFYLSKRQMNVLLKLNTETGSDKISAMEATFVYHIIKEGQSFHSAQCTSKLIREIFGPNPDFKCSETKSEAIATGKFSNSSVK